MKHIVSLQHLLQVRGRLSYLNYHSLGIRDTLYHKKAFEFDQQVFAAKINKKKIVLKKLHYVAICCQFELTELRH